MRRGSEGEVLHARETVLSASQIEVQIDAEVQAQPSAMIGIIRLHTEVMASVIEGVGYDIRQRTELQEIILHIQHGTHMVRLAMPVKRRVGPYLVFGYGTGFGKEHVSRLELVLEILFGIRLDAEERFCRPEGSQVFGKRRLIVGIRLLVLRPHVPRLGIVIPVTVFVVIDIATIETEIEVASGVGVGEIQSYLGLTQGSETPFRLMMRIDIKDGVLSVIEMIAEIKERVGVPYGSAQVSVIGFAGFEACRLREERIEGGARSEFRRVFGILDRRRVNRCLNHLRFGGYLACSLYHRLEIPLHGDGTVQGAVRLGESRNKDRFAQRQKTKDNRYTDIPEYRYSESINPLHCYPPFLQVFPVRRVLPSVCR